MTVFEQQEILKFPKIYYLGQKAAKLERLKHSLNLEVFNDGFDNVYSYYLHVLHDHIAYRYETLEVLGKGSFGEVLKAFDHKLGHLVALKIVRNSPRFVRQAIEEVRILERLHQDVDTCKHVLAILGHCSFRGHICLSFELMDWSLLDLLKRYGSPGLPLPVVALLASSILCGLCALQVCDVIHCDIKPDNVMVRHYTCPLSLKLIDFGSSCLSNERVYTCIQARCYRAPEILLGYPYGFPVDMWGFGCILVELITGCELFPAENEPDQILTMIKVLGVPPPQMLTDCKASERVFNTNLMSASQVGSLSEILRHYTTDSDIIELIIRCLDWNPLNRLTPKEAQQYLWILNCDINSCALDKILEDQCCDGKPNEKVMT